MPVARSSKAQSSKQPRASKAPSVTENVPQEKVWLWAMGSLGSLWGAPSPTSLAVLQEEGCQAKRSPSSPQGGPKKRSAFGDITNVSALLCSQPPHRPFPQKHR